MLFKTPLIATEAPDLELTSHVPPEVLLPAYNGSGMQFTWTFGITNRGLGMAYGVRLIMDSGEKVEMGNLRAGEGVLLDFERNGWEAGISSSRVTASSVVPDANPADNTVIAATRMKRPEPPSSKQLILGMTHLVVAPAGDRLYAAVARSAGEIEDGVAVINPESGTVERVLATGADPRRLAVSSDGTRLWVLVGGSVIERWNLLTERREHFLVLPGDQILDFVVVPGASTSVVVATTQRVTIFDNGQPRSWSYNYHRDVDRAHLGFAGSVLWVAKPGQLTPCAVYPDGLSPGVTETFGLFSDYYPFSSDGRRLYFSGAIFDTETRQRSDGLPGDMFCVDADNASIYSPVGSTLRRYSLDTHELLAEQQLFQASQWWMQDLVRWGSDGLAVRAGHQQLIIVRSPVVPAAAVADLAVSILSPQRAIWEEPIYWTVTVTNQSAQAAPRTVLTIQSPELHELMVDSGLVYAPFWVAIVELSEVPPFSSRSLEVLGMSRHFQVNLSASVISAATDPDHSNDIAWSTVPLGSPPADLSIHSVDVPTQVPVGDEFTIRCVVTNRGPELIGWTLLELRGVSSLELIGIGGGAYETNEYGVLAGALAPNQSKTVELRYRAGLGGLVIASASIGGVVEDPEFRNNRKDSHFHIVPESTSQLLTEFLLPGAGILAWDTSRQQLLASFPDSAWSLYSLEPESMAPTVEVPLPALPTHLVPCLDGRHAWVSLSDGEAVLVDLLHESIVEHFRYDPAQSYVSAIATPPEQPNLLLVALDAGTLGTTQVRVYENGVPRPVQFGPLGSTGGGVSMVFAPDGRLFVAANDMLRELRVVPSGLEEVRNLDHLGSYDLNFVTLSGDTLFYIGGSVVDLAGATVSNPFEPRLQLVADPETQRAFTIPWSRDLGTTYDMDCWGATDLNRLWCLPITTSWPSWGIGRVVPMGNAGVLIVYEQATRLNTGQLEPRTADVSVQLTAPATVDGAGLPFDIALEVVNHSPWTAEETRITVELSEGLLFAGESPGAGTLVATLEFGTFHGETNINLQVVPTGAGERSIVATAIHALPDPALDNNSSQAIITAMAPPLLFLDDTRISEGSLWEPGFLRARLSRPLAMDIQVNFDIEPITAGADDFVSLNSSFLFAAGQMVSDFYINGDDLSEPDETAQLRIVSDYVVAARAISLLTILNDDWPTVHLADVSVNEGNAGRTDAQFRMTLTPPVPFPVEVRFRTTPGTANSSADFLAREGWFRFEPGEQSRTLGVPVLGDTDYEPNETAALVLLETRNATLRTGQALLTIRNDDHPPAPVAWSLRLLDGSVRVEFTTIAGPTYSMQVRTNLTGDTWRSLTPAIVGDGNPASFSLPPLSTGQGFYRIMAR